MQLHQLQRVHKNYKPARVGRGGKRGKTSGRGTKGQLARAGHKLRPELRDIIKKIPKLRGRGRNFLKSTLAPTVALNLSVIEKHFNDGDVITKQKVFEKKIVKIPLSQNWNIKVLGGGEITKKVTIENIQVSTSAREKIEKAGGVIRV